MGRPPRSKAAAELAGLAESALPSEAHTRAPVPSGGGILKDRARSARGHPNQLRAQAAPLGPTESKTAITRPTRAAR